MKRRQSPPGGHHDCVRDAPAPGDPLSPGVAHPQGKRPRFAMSAPPAAGLASLPAVASMLRLPRMDSGGIPCAFGPPPPDAFAHPPFPVSSETDSSREPLRPLPPPLVLAPTAPWSQGTGGRSHPFVLPTWEALCAAFLGWHRPNSLLLAGLERGSTLYPSPHWSLPPAPPAAVSSPHPFSPAVGALENDPASVSLPPLPALSAAKLQHFAPPPGSSVPPVARARLPPSLLHLANVLCAVDTALADAALPSGGSRARCTLPRLQRDTATRSKLTVTPLDVMGVLTVMPEAWDVAVLAPATSSSVAAGVVAGDVLYVPRASDLLVSIWTPFMPPSSQESSAPRPGLAAGVPPARVPAPHVWPLVTSTRQARASLLARRLLYLSLLAELAPLRAIISGPVAHVRAPAGLAGHVTSCASKGSAQCVGTACASASSCSGTDGFTVAHAADTPPPYPVRTARAVEQAQRLWGATVAALELLAPTLRGPVVADGENSSEFVRVQGELMKLVGADVAAARSRMASDTEVFSVGPCDPSAAEMGPTPLPPVEVGTGDEAGQQEDSQERETQAQAQARAQARAYLVAQHQAQAAAQLWGLLPSPSLNGSTSAFEVDKAQWLPPRHYACVPSLTRDVDGLVLPLPTFQPTPAPPALATGLAVTAGKTDDSLVEAVLTGDSASDGSCMLPPTPLPSAPLSAALCLLDDCVFPPALTVTGLSPPTAAASDAAAATAGVSTRESSVSTLPSGVAAAAGLDAFMGDDALACVAGRARMVPTVSAEAAKGVGAGRHPTQALTALATAAAAACTSEAKVVGPPLPVPAHVYLTPADMHFPNASAADFFGPLSRHAARLTAAFLHPLRGITAAPCALGEVGNRHRGWRKVWTGPSVAAAAALTRAVTVATAEAWAGLDGDDDDDDVFVQELPLLHSTSSLQSAYVEESEDLSDLCVTLTKSAIKDVIAALRASTLLAQLEKKIGLLEAVVDAADVVRGLALTSGAAMSVAAAPVAAPAPGAAGKTGLSVLQNKLAALKAAAAARASPVPAPAPAPAPATAVGPASARVVPLPLARVTAALAAHDRFARVHGMCSRACARLVPALAAIAHAAAAPTAASVPAFALAMTSFGPALRVNLSAPPPQFTAAAAAATTATAASIKAIKAASGALAAAAAAWTAPGTGSIVDALARADRTGWARGVFAKMEDGEKSFSVPEPDWAALRGLKEECKGRSKGGEPRWRRLLACVRADGEAEKAFIAWARGQEQHVHAHPTNSSSVCVKVESTVHVKEDEEKCVPPTPSPGKEPTAKTEVDSVSTCHQKSGLASPWTQALSRFAGCARGRLYFLPTPSEEHAAAIAATDEACCIGTAGAVDTAEDNVYRSWLLLHAPYAPALTELLAAPAVAAGLLSADEAESSRSAAFSGGSVASLGAVGAMGAVVGWALRCIVLEHGPCEGVDPAHIAEWVQSL